MEKKRHKSNLGKDGRQQRWGGIIERLAYRKKEVKNLGRQGEIQRPSEMKEMR